MPLGEAIESDYIMWKPEQHRLAPKYDIMRSLEPLAKHYFVTMEEDYNQLKITCQRCNGFVICSGRSEELLYINFIHAGFFTLGLHPKYLFPENFYFQWHARTKMQCLYHNMLKEGNGNNK